VRTAPATSFLLPFGRPILGLQGSVHEQFVMGVQQEGKGVGPVALEDVAVNAPDSDLLGLVWVDEEFHHQGVIGLNLCFSDLFAESVFPGQERLKLGIPSQFPPVELSLQGFAAAEAVVLQEPNDFLLRRPVITRPPTYIPNGGGENCDGGRADRLHKSVGPAARRAEAR
jgi:hypothetical protein